ncbi:hypothetical protein Bbelb_183530 [Branchiostoma belcheri]|nr:hypothetical protein Bbelb_183530 [Branchiostoma belcheri]
MQQVDVDRDRHSGSRGRHTPESLKSPICIVRSVSEEETEEKTMTGQLTDEQLAEMKRQFQAHDKGSGKVTAQQMIDVLESVGVNLRGEQKQEHRDWIKDNTTGDGLVSVAEFLTRMQQSKALADSALAAFRMFDKDNSGYIDKDEIIQGMAQLGEQLTDEDAEEMLQECDTDGDGKINYEEFVKTFQ